VRGVQPAVALRSGLAVVGVQTDPGTGTKVVQRLRRQRPAGFRTWVTGEAATRLDLAGEVRRYAPRCVLVVCLAMLVLLFAMTGSLLVPLKALLMNALSLSASFGALVLIFQDGYGAGLLGVSGAEHGIQMWVPVVLFTFAFGLSMDYEVFLIARIKELRDAGSPNHSAVQRGLQRTGRVITGAATLMVIVFAGFVAGRMLAVKELGVAIALAVVLDATLVRCLLVPATMTLLGELNWWAPAPLRRLHSRLSRRVERTADQASGA
jgi:RND superfamily putative drug exporter